MSANSLHMSPARRDAASPKVPYNSRITRRLPSSAARSQRPGGSLRRRRRLGPFELTLVPESGDARTDAGSAAPHLVDHRACRRDARRRRDRLAHPRGPAPPVHVRRHPPPLEAGGERARGARRRARRSHRHAGVERLPAHGALLRRFGIGRRAAHDQSAALSGADRLHRQPRRRPVSLLRHDVRAARRDAGAADEIGPWLRRDDRWRAHAGDSRAEPPVLRRVDRRGVFRLRVASVRRAHRVVALLLVRDDGQPQRRAVLASLDGAAHLRRLHGGQYRAVVG